MASTVLPQAIGEARANVSLKKQGYTSKKWIHQDYYPRWSGKSFLKKIKVPTAGTECFVLCWGFLFFPEDLLLSYKEPLKQGKEPNQQGNKTCGNYSDYFLLDLLMLEDHEKSS